MHTVTHTHIHTNTHIHTLALALAHTGTNSHAHTHIHTHAILHTFVQTCFSFVYIKPNWVEALLWQRKAVVGERYLMMIIAFITWNSNFVPLIEGLCSSNPYRFEFSGFGERVCTTCSLYYVRVYTNTHTHTRMHAHTYTHTHTQTHKGEPGELAT